MADFDINHPAEPRALRPHDAPITLHREEPLKLLQSLTGLDTQAHAPGRMRIATLRHQLLNVPGRLIRHARGLTLRLAPGEKILHLALARLRALPAPT